MSNHPQLENNEITSHLQTPEFQRSQYYKIAQKNNAYNQQKYSQYLYEYLLSKKGDFEGFFKNFEGHNSEIFQNFSKNVQFQQFEESQILEIAQFTQSQNQQQHQKNEDQYVYFITEGDLQILEYKSQVEIRQETQIQQELEKIQNLYNNTSQEQIKQFYALKLKQQKLKLQQNNNQNQKLGKKFYCQNNENICLLKSVQKIAPGTILGGLQQQLLHQNEDLQQKILKTGENLEILKIKKQTFEEIFSSKLQLFSQISAFSQKKFPEEKNTLMLQSLIYQFQIKALEFQQEIDLNNADTLYIVQQGELHLKIIDNNNTPKNFDNNEHIQLVKIFKEGEIFHLKTLKKSLQKKNFTENLEIQLQAMEQPITVTHQISLKKIEQISQDLDSNFFQNLNDNINIQNQQLLENINNIQDINMETKFGSPKKLEISLEKKIEKLEKVEIFSNSLSHIPSLVEVNYEKSLTCQDSIIIGKQDQNQSFQQFQDQYFQQQQLLQQDFQFTKNLLSQSTFTNIQNQRKSSAELLSQQQQQYFNRNRRTNKSEIHAQNNSNSNNNSNANSPNNINYMGYPQKLLQSDTDTDLDLDIDLDQDIDMDFELDSQQHLDLNVKQLHQYNDKYIDARKRKQKEFIHLQSGIKQQQQQIFHL